MPLTVYQATKRGQSTLTFLPAHLSYQNSGQCRYRMWHEAICSRNYLLSTFVDYRPINVRCVRRTGRRKPGSTGQAALSPCSFPESTTVRDPGASDVAARLASGFPSLKLRTVSESIDFRTTLYRQCSARCSIPEISVAVPQALRSRTDSQDE